MTEDEIVDGLKQGLPGAFHALYGTHGRSLFSYLLRLTGKREIAEEISQDTFLTVIRKIEFFRVSSGVALKTWIFRIATHRAIDVIRREKRRALADQELDPAVTIRNPEHEISRLEVSEEMKAALADLSGPQRMAFLLRVQEEMSCWEISKIMGCSESAVKQLLYRTRNRLRRRLCPRIDLIPTSIPT